jgi:hypothetical protein
MGFVKECVVCGRKFEARRKKDMTCSEECRKLLHKEYLKDYHPTAIRGEPYKEYKRRKMREYRSRTAPSDKEKVGCCYDCCWREQEGRKHYCTNTRSENCFKFITEAKQGCEHWQKRKLNSVKAR